MSIPQNVLGRLRLGRGVAAEVEASLPDHRAWVYVFPIPDYEKATIVFEAGREPQVLSEDSYPFTGYLLRRIEVPVEKIEAFDGGRLDSADNPSLEQQRIVETEEQLEGLLLEHVADLACLREPKAAGYWFDEGPDPVEPEPYGDWFWKCKRAQDRHSA